jgi:hypothetical protein
MRIIAFIEDEENIKKILKHLNLWGVQNHDPPDKYKIPAEYQYLIKKRIVSFGSKEKIDNSDFDRYPDYETCDPIPNYEEWF